MSTKQQTDQSNQSSLNFDPQSMALYKSLTGAGGDVLKGYMNNPFGNASYKMGLGQSILGATKGGQNNMNALMQNMKVSGMGGSSGQGFQLAQQGRIGRSNQAMTGQANIQNVLAAMQRQMGATGMAMSFNPLVTGENSSGKSTQTTGGLGTWLPQLIGSGLGAASMFMGGGMGGGGSAGSIFKGTSGLTSGPSQLAGMNFPMQALGPAASAGPNPLMFGGGGEF